MADPKEIAPHIWQVPHETRVRVRYAETDQMGVVYYAHYAVWCEIGRTEWIRRFGLTYAQMEAEMGVLLPVRHFSITYHRPARYDDEVRIYTSLKEPPTRKLIFEHRLYREADLLAEAEVVLLFVQRDTWRPCSPPEAFYAALLAASPR